MPWQRLRRPHVLKIRSLLEENYRPSSANRMLAALRGVLRECWHAGLISTDDYQAASSVKAVRGESEPRGHDLSAGELRSLFEACARVPQGPAHQQDFGARRRRDAAFDFASSQLRVRQEAPSGAPGPLRQPALEDWLQVGGREPGPLFCAVLKTGRLVRESSGGLGRLSGSAAWAIRKERGQRAGIQAPAPHDLGRTWVVTCSSSPTWPPCSGWLVTPLSRPRLVATGGIMRRSARQLPSYMCHMSSRMTETQDRFVCR
jgi:integrase